MPNEILFLLKFRAIVALEYNEMLKHGKHQGKQGSSFSRVRESPLSK